MLPMPQQAFEVSGDGFMAVGAHRLTGEAMPFQAGQHLFRFSDQGAV